MDDVDMTICSAIFLLRPTTFISLVPTLLTDLGAEGLEPPVARTASRSDCWILPPLPLPATIERSIPDSLARLLTAGLASTVLFAALGAVAVGVTAGVVGWGDGISCSFSSGLGASGMASSTAAASTGSREASGSDPDPPVDSNSTSTAPTATMSPTSPFRATIVPE